MKKIVISSLLVTVVSFLSLGSNSISEEVVLCVSTVDQYVVTVNEKGDCLENESQIIISRADMAQKKNMTPLAKFTPNEDCDGQGIYTEIGFDENANGEPDANEIVSTNGTCTPLEVAEESGETTEWDEL